VGNVKNNVPELLASDLTVGNHWPNIAAMGSTNRLLIVDDQPGVTGVLEVTAIRLGFKVLVIHDTDEFEKALQTFSPTIVLLDIAMPGRDGVELIGHLARNNYPGQVVVMSGADPLYIQMSSTIAKRRGLRLAGTLLKPFRRQQVTDLLTRLAEISAGEDGQ
jgi:DNA-binding response OmpR family regulator